jgi:hypothetical protein
MWVRGETKFQIGPGFSKSNQETAMAATKNRLHECLAKFLVLGIASFGLRR